ncbi:hypothetical protein L6E12_07960 [Actinokineospora sp. PR83]|uniref:hypothetical protein n=1 Tax=Actinokineospora sp. PR83 TaxID=2884908 RepID=UPI001F30309A|nr:hypothetical protein [Actinokineospora sp. PR83]MCG8915720.1 hypothetical protein [Actinokineospora sp. PR83]
MTDHPAWLSTDERAWRVCRVGETVWSVIGSPGRVEVQPVSGSGATAPIIDVVDPGTVSGAADALVDPLRTGGAVRRLRNPDLWEALGTAAVRQVIRAAQARKLYRAFCAQYGERFETAAGAAWLFPRADVVLAMSDDDFERLGMKFFRRVLRSSAEVYLKFGDEWAELSADRLVDELKTIPRVGSWTAGAAVADYTNDFERYPMTDLAVRTWAKRLAPSVDWPEDEGRFGRKWRSMCGDHVSEMTMLTLSWGVRHATGVSI